MQLHEFLDGFSVSLGQLQSLIQSYLLSFMIIPLEIVGNILSMILVIDLILKVLTRTLRKGIFLQIVNGLIHHLGRQPPRSNPQQILKAYVDKIDVDLSRKGKLCLLLRWQIVFYYYSTTCC